MRGVREAVGTRYVLFCTFTRLMPCSDLMTLEEELLAAMSRGKKRYVPNGMNFKLVACVTKATFSLQRFLPTPSFPYLTRTSYAPAGPCMVPTQIHSCLAAFATQSPGFFFLFFFSSSPPVIIFAQLYNDSNINGARHAAISS